MAELIKRTELFRRCITADFEIRDAEGGTRHTMTFPASSELPVERWYGTEVLSHDTGAVKLSRAKDGAMPLLFNHNIDDPIGMISNARVKEGRLMVDARLFETARAAEVQTMIDGGLRNVSLAYRVNILEENKKTGTFTATDWEPYEVSIVTVPADPSVGIGRGSETEYDVRMIRRHSSADNATTQEDTMPEVKDSVADKAADIKIVEVETRVLSPVQQEQRRKEAIEKLCKTNKLDDSYRDMFIGMGMSLDQVADEMLKIMEERGKTNPTSIAKIGMGAKETKQFSLVRAIQACSQKDWSRASFELECCQEVAKRMNRASDPNKFYVPFEVLTRPTDIQLARGQRDMTVASAQGGGNLVETANMGFIEMLRNRSVLFRMGARNLSGLVGNVAIPRQAIAATETWLANEASTITESQPQIVQFTMSPKNVGAYTEISRQLLLQSDPSVEGIISSDLSQIVALAVDKAGISGSGAAGQPTGINNTSGTVSVTGASASYDGVLSHQVNLASNNVMPLRGGYVTTPGVAKLYMTRQRFTSTDTPLWVGNIWDGNMSGFPSMSSNQLASTSAIYFADWSEMIVAEWGVLEVEVNPYANFVAGIIGVRAIYSVDIGFRRPFAFSIQNPVS